MRLHVKPGAIVPALACLLASALSGQTSTPPPAARFTFHVLGNDVDSWPELLSSIGLSDGMSTAGVVVAPHAIDQPFAEWAARVDRGTMLVLEGESPLAAAFGFKRTSDPMISVRSVEDLRDPELRIIWEAALALPIFQMPKDARVFARERHGQSPLIAGFRRGAGAVLWVAAPPGARGYDRFPYLMHALNDLGLRPPVASRRLWAFFDSAYRSRVDLDYFAARWRAEGVSALHVAAWHFWERDAQADDYLRRLIQACHQHGVLVYAWLELPHVSERFWADHPEWREKTALLQDAQLDWRKLMNLSRPEAFAAVSRGLTDLMTQFDWDGANLAELYFESLEGANNAARLTPMSDDVRAEFRHDAGFDPLELFQAGSARYWSKNAPGLTRFLEYRAVLAQRQQAAWIEEIEKIRKTRPQLDLTLTHIDDRFDNTMREKLGADTSRVLPLLGQHNFTFLIEDPATVWNLGPQRYPQIAARYAAATPQQEKLAIDINIVDRYQDVYPTKSLVGSELLETVHMAASAFPRVALYFENSITHADAPLLSASAASVERLTELDGRLMVQSKRGVGVLWNKPPAVDGKPWPFFDGATVWLPSGNHVIDIAAQAPAGRILDFNGDLRDASLRADGAIEFLYESSSRALAVLEPAPESIEIDGKQVKPEMFGAALMLPRGVHSVTARLRPNTKLPQTGTKGVAAAVASTTNR